MKMATMTEHTNISVAPHTSRVSNLRSAKVFEITSPPGWCHREREDGEEAKPILDSVKQISSAHQAPCSIAVLKAILKHLQ